MKPKYKRILLKLSGEALMGDGSYGIHRETIGAIGAHLEPPIENHQVVRASANTQRFADLHSMEIDQVKPRLTFLFEIQEQVAGV